MRTVTFPIVGAHFRPPAKAILQVLPNEHPLLVRPEPTNEHDPNALAVFIRTETIPEDQRSVLWMLAEGFGFSEEDILEQLEWHLGYIPRTEAEVLASSIPDKEVEFEGKMGFDLSGKPTITFSIGDQVYG